MCFSPQADLVGGIVIGAIGIDTLRHAEKRPSHLAIAALPALLAFHQFDEAFIWFGLEGHVPKSIEHVALWIYLIIAFVILPLYVPLAVMGWEETAKRKWTMAPFALIGAYVSAALLHAMLTGPFSVALRPYHLAYSLRLGHTPIVVGLYVVAVCGAFLFSGARPMIIFGIINLVAVIVIVILTVDGFASVWCGWAAVSSGAIAFRFRAQHRHRISLNPA